MYFAIATVLVLGVGLVVWLRRRKRVAQEPVAFKRETFSYHAPTYAHTSPRRTGRPTPQSKPYDYRRPEVDAPTQQPVQDNTITNALLTYAVMDALTSDNSSSSSSDSSSSSSYDSGSSSYDSSSSSYDSGSSSSDWGGGGGGDGGGGGASGDW